MIPSRNRWLLFETMAILILLSLAAWKLAELRADYPLAVYAWPPLLLFQGLWFYRLYIVGHEAAHRKLVPGNRFLNDLLGSLALLPLMVPVTIYRKIHYFHHGFNRLDPHTSMLDTYVIKGKATRWKIFKAYLLWYLSVFAGGFFLHSLVSVFLFLFLPPSAGRNISPAFRNWTWKDQLQSIALFLLGVGLHVAVYRLGGLTLYAAVLGFPMLAFAWVLSLLLYIFHYDTSHGKEVRFHVRSTEPVPVLSWVLMNFQEHATHHQHPEIPWYELPEKRAPLPDDYAQRNRSGLSFFRAVFQQLKGPNLVYDDPVSPR